MFSVRGRHAGLLANQCVLGLFGYEQAAVTAGQSLIGGCQDRVLQSWPTESCRVTLIGWTRSQDGWCVAIHVSARILTHRRRFRANQPSMRSVTYFEEAIAMESFCSSVRRLRNPGHVSHGVDCSHSQCSNVVPPALTRIDDVTTIASC